MWHWQQYYVIIMWCFSIIVNLLVAVTSDSTNTRAQSIGFILATTFMAYVIWSGGFFS